MLESGISPTELEYDLFNKAHNDAYIFVKQAEYRDENTIKSFIKSGMNVAINDLGISMNYLLKSEKV